MELASSIPILPVSGSLEEFGVVGLVTGAVGIQE